MNTSNESPISRLGLTEILRERALLLKLVRQFFEDRGFLEVETPILSRDVVVDRHLDPLRVTLFSDPRQPEAGPTYWLQTSPEFAMKRLLAEGAPSLFQITKAFRGGDVGPIHNPEFTMVEWYGVGHDYEDGRRILGELAMATTGAESIEQVRFRDAFRANAEIDPMRASMEEIHNRVKRQSPDESLTNWDRDAALDWLLTRVVEPNLGTDHPCILFDYPASQAALAKTREEEDYVVAERFELYYHGVELANGYHELLDPEVLQSRAQSANQERARDGKFQLPEQSQLMEAMRKGLPPCAGCALGFDRLLMARLRKKSFADVAPFTIANA